MASTFVWTGLGANQYWFTTGNWNDITTGGVATVAPGAGDTVEFNSGTDYVFGAPTVAAVDIAPGAKVELGTMPGGVNYTFGTASVGSDATLTLLGGTTMTVGTAEIAAGAAFNMSQAWYVGVSTEDPNAVADAATTPATGGWPGPVSSTIQQLTLDAGGTVVLGDRNLGVGVLDNGNSDAGNAFDPAAGISGSGSVVAPSRSAVADAPCFVAGTRIQTAAGEVPVEMLRPGDLVRTAGGRTAPVIWVGSRTVALPRGPGTEGGMPVRIAAGALAPGVPRRDLLVSADHAVLVAGALIPAHRLRNGATVRVAAGLRAVTYVHVELDRHDLLLAEAMPAESYLDTGNRAQFADETGVRPLFPPPLADRLDASREAYATRGCAPLCLDGAALRRARRMLLARARTLGWRLVPDAALRVAADGVVLAAVQAAPARLAFALPAGARELRLTSRAFVPSELDADPPDSRRLGMAVAIGLDGAALPEAAFAAGWYPPERGCEWRWMGGDARLQLASAPPGARLTITVVDAGARYWLAA